MSSNKTINSKFILYNILAAMAIVAILVFGAYKWMDIYTEHGQFVKVPDLKNIQQGQLDAILANTNLRFEVADSGYRDGFSAGAVYEQIPSAGAMVKAGRIVYVSIATGKIPKVKLPQLIDLSLRQAQIMLSNVGLQIGDITQQPDIYTNNVVLSASLAGTVLKAGDMVPNNAKINLTVSINNIDSSVVVPSVEGLNLIEADMILTNSLLSLGSVIVEGTVTDSTQLIVTRQNPIANNANMLKVGAIVDVWLKQK